MFKNIKISTKITGLVVAMALITVLAVSFFTYDYNLKARQEKYGANLGVIADSRALNIEYFFNHQSAALSQIAELSSLKTALDDIKNDDDGGFFFSMSDDEEEESDELNDEETEDEDEDEELLFEDEPALDNIGGIISKLKNEYKFADIVILNSKGIISASTNPGWKKGQNFNDPDGTTLSESKKGIHFSNVLKENKDYLLYAGVPVRSASNETYTFLAKIKLNSLFEIFNDVNGLGKTGETFAARFDAASKKVVIVSPLRNDPGAALKIFDNTDKAVASVTTALHKGSGYGIGSDYLNKQVMEAYKPVGKTNWAVVSKVDLDEIKSETSGLLQWYIASGVVIILISGLLSLFFARSLTSPLNSVRNTLELVSQGVLPEDIKQESSDEFGMMSNSVSGLVNTLRRNAEFARKIGEGNFDAEFKVESKDDQLGLALLNMRQNLVDNEKREKERTWIVRGVAEVGEILRNHDNLEALGEEMVRYIVNKIDAVQGAYYIVNDEAGNVPLIEMRASFAFGRKKYLKKTFKFAEGLVGQAAIEKDTILRTEIPDDYMTITSGILGDQKPKCILIVPLITNEEVFGVLEFAGLRRFDSRSVNFVQELSVILARTIFNIKVNERTRRLLAESQAMSQELQEKQEVLRQNAEEMEATQEELKRSNTMLEEQIEEVNRTQKRMQLLLENASEVITIYEDDETIRYISTSVGPILGYAAEELVGKSDLDHVHPDYRDVFKNIFTQLRKNPDERVTVQYEYKTRSGNYIWIETSGTNLMSNAAIHGYILNSRDITERRLAEQEQRMRSKMQALSENSPDLITRIEHGTISYINPIIENYSGIDPANFLNKDVREVSLDTAILDSWLRIVEQVNSSNTTVSTEMDFPSEMGNRVMQVNAIPEYDENETLESVLVVSHDITERKVIELEIQNKNKKIADSINYAKRIQGAILPNTRLINKALPESFILYKPKDVVSGDFPWYVQIKDEIYIAAVDCTGHGVPGALLSLIGYFLLNDIVRSRKITEPGKILDLLDEGVTQTLRQDQEDSSTRDGMDIALCRINTATREIAYAGAHRPLYIMTKNGLEEIKGNKFPIGGGIFKNQTNFTNTEMKLAKGDAIFFCSDGYPDQFGGPEGRKMGPKKLREIVERVHKLPMKQAHEIFDMEWENWRGEQKQTDDVLLIGIKF